MKQSLFAFIVGATLFTSHCMAEDDCAKTTDLAAATPMPTQESTEKINTDSKINTIPLGIPTWFDIPTTDLEKSKSFYTELFGWTYLSTKVNNEDYWYIQSQHGSSIGGLYQHADANKKLVHSIVVYFSVPNIEETISKAEKLGATVLVPKTIIAPGEGFFAIINDTDNNALGLVSVQ